MSNVEAALRQGRVVFVLGASPQMVRRKVSVPIVTKAGYRHGIGGTYVALGPLPRIPWAVS